MCGGTIYASHPIKSLCTDNSLCVVSHYIPVTQSNHCVLTTVCVWRYIIYQSPNQITVYRQQSVCGGTIYASHSIKSLCTINSPCVVVHYIPVTQSNHCVLTTVCVWWYIIYQSPNQITVYRQQSVCGGTLYTSHPIKSQCSQQYVCGGTIYTSHPIKSLRTDNSQCVVVHYISVTQSNHCVLTTVCVWWYILYQSPNQIIVY